MIVFLLGTKAQLIKCAPVIQAVAGRGLPFRMVGTGQHAGTLEGLLRAFALPPLDATLDPREKDVDSLGEGLSWLARSLLSILSGSGSVVEAFGPPPGICLVHGDTASTWLGVEAALRFGFRVGHLEAGLESGSILSPFPEELIRRSVMRRAHYLFAPGRWAVENIRRRGYPGKAVELSGNTNLESLHLVLKKLPRSCAAEPFLLASIHRLETIQRRESLARLVEILEVCVQRIPVRFVVHSPTRRRLEKARLWDRLEKAGIELLPPQAYPDFVCLLRDAHGVLSDGGSVQEECAYLGTPCLLWRATTERPEGLGENVVLSHLAPQAVHSFLERLSELRRPSVPLTTSPSAEIADLLAAVCATATSC